MTNFKKRSNFTLLELMVCITILGIIAGGIAWNLKGLLDRSSSDHAAGKFRVNMQELKILALTHHADFEIFVSEDKENVYYQNATDEPISVNRAKHLLGKNCFLTFNDHPTTSLKITLYSTGRIEPQGIMGVHKRGTLKEKGSFWVDLENLQLIKKLGLANDHESL